MDLPFTVEQFFAVFRRYNEAVWPAQLLLYGIAAAMLVALWRRSRGADRIVGAGLAVLWAWTGVAYHFAFFRAINPAAVLFAGLSLAGAAAFAWQGVARPSLVFAWHADARGALAGAVIAYALLVYPAIAVMVGHGWWGSPTFGAPCPTTIFTLGVLLLATPRWPLAPLLAPLLWALVGSSAALLLGVPQDLGLAVAAAIVIATAMRDRARGEHTAASVG